MVDEIEELAAVDSFRPEGWEQLMGNDILLKLTKADDETSSKSSIDSEFIPDNPVNQGEVGDYILIDFDGYHWNDDDDHGERNDAIDYKSFFKDKKPFIQERDWLITLGNGDVLPGLEMAIRFLELDQCGIVKCHSKYAYGVTGRNGGIGVVPKNMNIMYKVKIKSIIPQNDTKAKSIPFQIKLYQQMKCIGNHYFKNDWMDPDGGLGKTKALKLYNSIAKDGVSMLEDVLEHGSNERREMFYITVDSLNNMTAVYLRLKDYRKAKDVATQTIQLDPYNLKALCRAAKASLMIGEFEECKAALDVAEEIVDDVDTNQGYTKRDVKKLKREFIVKKREYKKLEKEIFAQMLSKNKDDTMKKKLSGKKLLQINGNKKKSLQTRSNDRDEGNKLLSKRQQNNIHGEQGMKQQSFIQMFSTYVFAPIVAILVWIYLTRDQNKIN